MTTSALEIIKSSNRALLSSVADWYDTVLDANVAMLEAWSGIEAYPSDPKDMEYAIVAGSAGLLGLFVLKRLLYPRDQTIRRLQDIMDDYMTRVDDNLTSQVLNSGEEVQEIKAIVKTWSRQKKKRGDFITHVALVVRSEFGGRAPENTMANHMVMENKAREYMKSLGHRDSHIVRDMPDIRMLVFCPTRLEAKRMLKFKEQVAPYSRFIYGGYPGNRN
jgi:hypothetical protein